MRRFLVALILLAAGARPAPAQFIGYVGLQTDAKVVLTNSTSTGRTIVQANTGASYHTFTYCLSTPNVAVQLVIEESPDKQPQTFTQVSPVSEFPWQSINGNNCGVIRVGGYYSVMAVDVLFLSGGSISVWYTSTGGPTDLYPPAINSAGGTSPVDCDQTIASTFAPGAMYQLVTMLTNQGIYICGGDISFSGATTAGMLALNVGNANCAGVAPVAAPLAARHEPVRQARITPRAIPFKPEGRPPILTAGSTVWLNYVTPQTPQTFQINASKAVIRIPPTPAGVTLCLNVGSITANVALTLFFAQF